MYGEKNQIIRKNADKVIAEGLEDLYENNKTAGVNLILGLIDLLRLMEEEIVELHDKIDNMSK